MNVIEAVKAAKSLGIFTVGLTGGEGGQLASLVDLALVVKSRVTGRIQETHILLGHIICELVDYILFQQGVPEE
jgi:D-sedoheptulose 7-phosphate isomerase